MTKKDLIHAIRKAQNFLCVGLDTDIAKIPRFLLDFDDPIFEFNKRIIDATAPYAVSYKMNTAFYECLGPKGWISLEKTLAYIPPDKFTIADAKRGDIGNTSRMYAQTFFEYYNFDAVTVAPYMGSDSVLPFMSYPNKWVILLGVTSNEGAKDFQFIADKNNMPLYKNVIQKAQEWGTADNLMFVTGATRPESIAEIRLIAQDYFLLVPGIGAQGGDLSEVYSAGANNDIGLLINSSRDILYVDNSINFEQAVTYKAQAIAKQMADTLNR